jgi:hypothetical protein
MIKRIDIQEMFCGEDETDKIEQQHEALELETKQVSEAQAELLKNFHKITARVLSDLAKSADSEECDEFAAKMHQLEGATRNLQRISAVTKSLFEMEDSMQETKKQNLPNPQRKRIGRVDLHIMLDACRRFGFIREGCEKDIPRILKEFEEDGHVTPYPYNIPPPDWEENREKYGTNPIGCLDAYFEKMLKEDDARAEWELFMEKQLRARREERDASIAAFEGSSSFQI